MTFANQMESEYMKVKNDPLKLQLFNVKKKEYLKKLQYTREATSEVINKINELEKPKCICVPQPIKITKINNINPSGIIVSKTSKLHVSESKGNNSCTTRFIKFKIPGPTKWMYNYNLQRLTTNNISDFVIDVNSVPSDHIKMGECTASINLYIFDGMWKELTILFTPSKETEEGSVIRTRAITIQ